MRRCRGDKSLKYVGAKWACTSKVKIPTLEAIGTHSKIRNWPASQKLRYPRWKQLAHIQKTEMGRDLEKVVRQTPETADNASVKQHKDAIKTFDYTTIRTT